MTYPSSKTSAFTTVNRHACTCNSVPRRVPSSRLLLDIGCSVFCNKVAARIVLQVEAPGPQEDDAITYTRDLGSNLQTEFLPHFFLSPPTDTFSIIFLAFMAAHPYRY